MNNLPEPIDLDLDPVNRTLYWTDRGDPPRGNTVNRAPMDPAPENGKEPEILFSHLMEGSGGLLGLGRPTAFALLPFCLQLPEVVSASLCDLPPALPSKSDGGGIFLSRQNWESETSTPGVFMH
jgi:hypothetical protein